MGEKQLMKRRQLIQGQTQLLDLDDQQTTEFIPNDPDFSIFILVDFPRQYSSKSRKVFRTEAQKVPPQHCSYTSQEPPSCFP
mmetsp:Transcript_51744/g.108093  ORF Transcript_51744/g.108093 Transcript_51744/m.108093 type:complete len:82 (-) Transcript_51744:1599-1844(-)